MIKIVREPEPEKLISNKPAWLKKLQEAMDIHGNFASIPQSMKNNLTSHYRDREIKEPLLKSSHEKCAFCECIPGGGGYPEIDHFKPKSIYPLNVFDWDNLVPTCKRCNNTKNDHDTGTLPLVNPYDTDPENIFEYEFLYIKVRTGMAHDIPQRTIDLLHLNDVRLTRQRAEILIALQVFEENLDNAIKDKTLSNNMRIALSRIEDFKKPEKKLRVLADFF